MSTFSILGTDKNGRVKRGGVGHFLTFLAVINRTYNQNLNFCYKFDNEAFLFGCDKQPKA